MSLQVGVRVCAKNYKQRRNAFFFFFFKGKEHTLFMRRPRICLRSSFRASSRSDSAFPSLRKDRKSLAPRTSFEKVHDGNALVEQRFLRVF